MACVNVSKQALNDSSVEWLLPMVLILMHYLSVCTSVHVGDCTHSCE